MSFLFSFRSGVGRVRLGAGILGLVSELGSDGVWPPFWPGSGRERQDTRFCQFSIVFFLAGEGGRILSGFGFGIGFGVLASGRVWLASGWGNGDFFWSPVVFSGFRLESRPLGVLGGGFVARRWVRGARVCVGVGGLLGSPWFPGWPRCERLYWLAKSTGLL